MLKICIINDTFQIIVVSLQPKKSINHLYQFIV